MNIKKQNDISKFLSYVLRHKPEAINIKLDIEGWANIEELLTKSEENGKTISLFDLHQIVKNSDKKRFTISSDKKKIRAAQGHSTNTVSLKYLRKKPPKILYHGTADRFLSPILQEGLISGNRHYVHLSEDETTALNVGKRYGKSITLKIEALQMYKQGFDFFQSENNVWLTHKVPKEFIQHK